MPKEKFSIIYADPPWRYEQKNRQGSAELHYPTMSIEEICSLPVADLAAKDSVLFLWATFPQLPEALKVIKAWGFSYRSVAFVWIKRNRRSYSWFYGLGYWTRGNAEICLLAVKGHPKRKSAGIIAGGMIPKIGGMADAIYQGVHEAVIIDGRVPHSILLELFSNRGSGTRFYRRSHQE